MGWDRWPGQAKAALYGLAVTGAAVWFWKVKWGQSDPTAAVLAAIAVLIGLVGSLRPKRLTDTDVDQWAKRLAIWVHRAETLELQKLLGQDGQADQANKPIDVEFALLPTVARRADGAQSLGCLTKVTEYYRRLQPGRLFITGAPGAGKTVLALHLILGLLSDRDPDRVPVRVSAAQWDTSRSLPEFVNAHLSNEFGLPPRTAAALVDAGRILPVIDGLDEMDRSAEISYSSRTAKAVRKLNKYQDGTSKAPVVLLCSSEQYDRLDHPEIRVRLQDAAHVQIKPVSPISAQDFLENRLGKDCLRCWESVLDALDFHHEGPLACALSSPLYLTLAVTIYEQRDPTTGHRLRDPKQLTAPGLNTSEKIREYLLSSYITAVTTIAAAANRNRHGYSPAQVRAWLGALAHYLDTNASRPPFAGRILSSTDIVLHELWPLAGDRPRLILTGTIACTTFVSLTEFLLSYRTPFPLTGAFVGSLLLTRLWRVQWPKPARIDLPRLKTRVGSIKLMVGILFGLICGLILGSVIAISRGWVSGVIGGPIFALLFALGVWLVTPGVGAVLDPRDPVRNDFAAGLISGIKCALGLGLATWLTIGLTHRTVPLLVWVLIWFEIVLASRRAVTRYWVLCMCTYGRLPLRIGRFLQWCRDDAGLIRVAGISYQFRNRELRDYLARHYSPPPIRRRLSAHHRR